MSLSMRARPVPCLGEHVLEEMLAEARVTIVRSVGGVESVAVGDKRIERVVFENGAPYCATIWIDASYEGAILERVATMVWGREGQEQYNETSAGRREFMHVTGGHSGHVSPYWDDSLELYISRSTSKRASTCRMKAF